MGKGRNTKQWFRRERLVWGWHPITWHGWTAVSIYLCLLVCGSWLLLPHNRFEHTDSLKILIWLTFMTLATVSLGILIWRKSEAPQERYEEERDVSDEEIE